MAFVQIDFNTQHAAPAGWNSTDDNTTSGTLTNMDDEDSGATTWDWDMDIATSGQNGAGTNADHGDFPANVRRDSFFNNNGVTAQMTISGLDNGETYEVQIEASRGTTTLRVGEYTVGGVMKTIDAGVPADNFNSWTGVSPSGGGIVISFTDEASSTFSYISGMRIQQEVGGSVMNQMQNSNLGVDLYNGTIL